MQCSTRASLFLSHLSSFIKVVASLLVAFVSSRPQTAGQFRFQKAIAAPIRNPLQQSLPPSIAVHQIRDDSILNNERISQQDQIQNQNAK